VGIVNEPDHKKSVMSNACLFITETKTEKHDDYCRELHDKPPQMSVHFWPPMPIHMSSIASFHKEEHNENHNANSHGN